MRGEKERETKKRYKAVVVVKWSAYFYSNNPSSNQLGTVFSVLFMFEKKENKQKRPVMANF